jgi:hypothetical protein
LVSIERRQPRKSLGVADDSDFTRRFATDGQADAERVVRKRTRDAIRPFNDTNAPFRERLLAPDVLEVPRRVETVRVDMV